MERISGTYIQIHRDNSAIEIIQQYLDTIANNITNAAKIYSNMSMFTSMLFNHCNLKKKKKSFNLKPVSTSRRNVPLAQKCKAL